MIKEWKQFDPSAFSFEILEKIKMEETQTETETEFIEDTNILLEIWKDKLDS